MVVERAIAQIEAGHLLPCIVETRGISSFDIHGMTCHCRSCIGKRSVRSGCCHRYLASRCARSIAAISQVDPDINNDLLLFDRIFMRVSLRIYWRDKKGESPNPPNTRFFYKNP